MHDSLACAGLEVKKRPFGLFGVEGTVSLPSEKTITMAGRAGRGCRAADHGTYRGGFRSEQERVEDRLRGSPLRSAGLLQLWFSAPPWVGVTRFVVA